MIKHTHFDVLVVYTHDIATSASSTNPTDLTPFPLNSARAGYNDAYGYLLESCRAAGLKAAFTTSEDLLPSGAFSSHWRYADKKWQSVIGEMCTAPLIFDKFAGINELQKERRQILFSDSDVRSFNSPHLHSLFSDKQKTFNQLREFAIPTVTIKNRTNQALCNATSKLKAIVQGHQNTHDFSDSYVVKDRFGAGGNRIFKVEGQKKESQIGTILKAHRGKSFILQPFTRFDQGYRHQGAKKSVDMRIVFMGQDILFTYIRIAKSGDFKCNQHLGGTLEYLSPHKLPIKVVDMAQSIADGFSSSASLFALDFVMTNSGNIYLMEGNCGPGINWDPTSKSDEFYCKKLIRAIVSELSKRTIAARITSEKPVFDVLHISAYNS